MNFKRILILLPPALLLSGCQNPVPTQDLSVMSLRTEMLVNPDGIDVPNPRFSWEIISNQRNTLQTDYQIMVASTPEKLASGEADLWNSGKVRSEQSNFVKYAGTPLQSRIHCYWKVRIWSENGESEWSEPAHWSMGLLKYTDWQGDWIGFDRAFPWDSEETFSRLSARYFRKEFKTGEKQINSATVYIIGLGLYELYINGHKIGAQVLSPSPTDYSKNVKYNTFNVTGQIYIGINTIGAILGNGRYYTMRQNYKPYKIKTFGYPKLLLNLVIDYTDGTTDLIYPDDSWKGTADGPIRTNNEYDGEEYDARKEMTGWNQNGFDDEKWLQAEYVQEPFGEYEAQMNENMKVKDSISPVSLIAKKSGIYILDMGENMVGWISMKVNGKRGDRVQMRFAETLTDEGYLYTANLRDARATDVYILKGDGEETWEPTFVYHGFRYAEITGYPGTPSIENFTGKIVYDDIQTTGSFETSNETINQVYQNAFRGIRGNYKGMPVDCPQRNERQPWLGDRAIGSLGESFIFDAERLYTKWLDDIHYSQKSDGSIPDVAPAFWRYYTDNMTWPGTYIIIADMLYNQYGDIQPVQKHYESMKKWLGYMKKNYMTDCNYLAGT